MEFSLQDTPNPMLEWKSSAEPEMVPAHQGDQAMKLHLLLGPESPGFTEVSNAFTTGTADAYRRKLAQQEQLNQINARNDVLSSVFNSDPKAITPELVSIVQGLSEAEFREPDLSDIIEKKYAEKYTNLTASALQNEVLEDSLEENPEMTYELLDRHERVAYKKNVAATEMSILQKEIDDMSWTSTIWNFTERMVPFVEWMQKADAVGSDTFVSSILPGSNLEEQFAYLWLLEDLEQFKTEFLSAVSEMKERNPYTAASWVEGFFSYGGSDALVDNIFGIADVAEPAGSVVKFGKAMKGALKGAARSLMKPYRQAADIGNYDEAAEGKIVEEVSNGTFVNQDMKLPEEISDVIPSISDPNKMLVGTSSVPQAAYLRLKQAVMANADLAKRFLDVNQVQTITGRELIEQADVLRAQFVKDNPSIQNNVIDVRLSKGPDVGNVYQAEVVIAKRDGTLFESEKQAENYFKRFVKGTDDFEIEQVGSGYQIVISKNVDESKLYDMTLQTTQKSQDSLSNTFAPWLRSPNYQVSRESELARSTVTTGSEELRSIYQEMAEPWGRLSNESRKELEDVVRLTQHKSYYKNYDELDLAFYDKYKKPVSLDQAEAYFSYVQMNDLDYIVRNLSWYKQKVSQGREMISIGKTDLKFEGKVLDELPQGDFRYVVIEDGKIGSVKSSKFLTKDERTKLGVLSQKGYKVVQVADQNLKVGEKSYAGFVVTNNLKRDKVSMQAIPYKPGGHKIDKYQGYIKQGKLSRSDATYYRGDTTLYGVNSEKEGREAIEILERWRQAYLRNDKSAMKIIRDELGIDSKRWVTAIKTGVVDPTVPFAYTRRGVRSVDTGIYSAEKNLVDTQKNPFNLDNELMGKFGSERSETDLKGLSSEGDQLFEVQPAEFLSPMETLKNASQSMINARLIDDYTIQTERNFIREFGSILDATKEELLATPREFLIEPRFRSGANPLEIQKAKNVSASYRNLLNMQTPLDRKVSYVVEKLASSVIETSGPRGRWLPEKALSSTRDPGRFMRSFAFHTKMGFWNPIQYFVQMNSMINVASIAGTNGLRGGAVYPMVRASMINPRMTKTMGNIAERVGLMKADEFEESIRLYKKSGYHNLGGDVAYLDDIASNKLIQGRTGKILASSRLPFNEGERAIRIAAWNAAYLEKKAQLAGKAISRRDEMEILQRAKDLGANMTRESNATWQKGYASVMTQFFGYQARIMEQFVGKKLTGAEKARLFTGYSALYGIPVATGAVAGVWPIRETVMDYAMEWGWDINDPLFEPFVDGFVSSMYEYITGDELNFASRYGPGGLPTFRDLIRQDSSILDTFLGASGSIGLEAAGAALPTAWAMLSEFMDFEGGYNNVTSDDILKVFRSVSTVDNSLKLWYAWNTGIWASKNGNLQTMIEQDEALAAVLTGLTPARIEDAFRAKRAEKTWKDQQYKAVDKAAKEYRKIMQMEPGKEKDVLIRELKSWMIMNGLTDRQMKEAWKRAADTSMMTDKFMDNYEKELDRRNLEKWRVPNG